MGIPGFAALTDDLRNRVRGVEVERTLDGKLIVVLRDAAESAIAMDAFKDPKSWDDAQNLVAVLLTTHGLDSASLAVAGSRTWRARAGRLPLD